MTKRVGKTKTNNTDKPARKVGRPRVYTPEELEVKFEEYRKYIAANPIYKEVPTKSGPMDIRVNRPMTIVGFCQFAGISKDTFCRYEDAEEFCGLLTCIREAIEADQLEGALCEQYNPGIVARVLRLADRQDVTTNGKDIHQTPPVSFTVDAEAVSIIQSIGKQTIHSTPEDGD